MEFIEKYKDCYLGDIRANVWVASVGPLGQGPEWSRQTYELRKTDRIACVIRMRENLTGELKIISKRR